MKKPSNQIFVLVATLAPSFGFHVVAPQKSRAVSTTLVHAESSSEMNLSTGEPFQNTDVDMDRARECAEHFGRCSTKEMRKLRDDLHRERIHHSLFGDHLGGIIAAPEETFEHHMIEEELNLQLGLLSEQMPDAYLFPKEDVPELPHLKDAPAGPTTTEFAKKNVNNNKNKGYEEIVKHEKEVHMFEELAEEGVLESLAVCGILALAFIAPQVLFN